MGCEAAVNPNIQQHLQDLLGKMQEDFHEHWGDTFSYSSTTEQSSRRCHKGTPPYSHWALALDALALDPRTKRKVSKLLQEHLVTLIWIDIHDAIKKIMKQETTTPPQEEEIQQEGGD